MSVSNALKRATRTGIVPAMIAGGLVAAFAAPPKPAATPDKPRRSLVLITLDTTRADHLGSYGWKAARTPNLDALAARGTRFVRCDTAAPVTLPSHATILTGLFPPRTGVRDNGTFVLADKVETVAERLAAHGYDTAAAVSAIVLARRHGLNHSTRAWGRRRPTWRSSWASAASGPRPCGCSTPPSRPAATPRRCSWSAG